MLGELNASPESSDLSVFHAVAVPDKPLQGELPVEDVPSGGRAPGLEHRPGPFQGRPEQLWLQAHRVDAGPPVDHELKPLVRRGVVPVAEVVAEQRLGGVEGGRGRRKAQVGQLKPPQPGVQARPLQRVHRAGQGEPRPEGVPGLVASADAPQHAGELGVQPRGVRVHGPGLPPCHRQGRVKRGDRLMVGERVGRVVAGHLEVTHGALGVFGGRVVAAEDGGDLGQAVA